MRPTDPDRHHQPRRRRLPGERPAAEYVGERLADAGLSSRRCWSAPRAGPTSWPASRAPTRRADALLVHGHLDVVPAERRRLERAPLLRRGPRRRRLGPRRRRHEEHGRDGARRASGPGPARACGPRRDIVHRLHRRRGGQRRGRLGLPRRPSTPDLFEGCTEGISESGAFTFHDGGGRQLYPIAAGERGTAWLKLTARGRAGHGSKVNRENAVDPARRRRRPDRRARVAAAAHPDRAGRARPNSPRCTASTTDLTDVDAPARPSSARPPRWSGRPSATAPTRRCWTPVTRST